MRRMIGLCAALVRGLTRSGCGGARDAPETRRQDDEAAARGHPDCGASSQLPTLGPILNAIEDDA